MPQANELAVDRAHLWVVRPETVLQRRLVARYERLLTPEEHERRSRYRTESGRLDYLVTRVLVRTALSHYTGVAPEAWRFAARPSGKPEVAEPRRDDTPRFSLSHTRGLVACLVASDRDVGVDVENTTRSVSFLDIAERYFAPREVTEILSLPGPDARRRFFEYWTLKESLIKAREERIASGLSRYTFRRDDTGIRASIDAAVTDDWCCRLHDVGPDHLVASSLMTETGEQLHVDVRETVPLIDG
ncbi:MAG: 4'-phosphopantetheinyl transferase superfamily protein [Acidobacteria bacterium]|nr:4'-phosphopantetheinyl transferase superfamily protein [Acidobacteriota bacterium]NIM62841.1 4'-phosphopantetheinyl transferase superfamily protein [Acidobacteriota bacterium]NIO60471.1 4'-phosphopantetheinyl transferase superfamily protein [Acidobacteriota bacterium]NIQ31577.1 4'-phosphopantetheinyl transferase superfamily protein [Acidobacteriota bacterium]NIQ86827.1 4'-phosphopantetheinyl transferase superfamily protein [Acidobacteriota bacterium]